jgi:hypothetical protein
MTESGTCGRLPDSLFLSAAIEHTSFHTNNIRKLASCEPAGPLICPQGLLILPKDSSARACVYFNRNSLVEEVSLSLSLCLSEECLLLGCYVVWLL